MVEPDLREKLLVAFYPEGKTCQRLIETHISWVVLTGPWAFKVKKPLRFDFLDYSTLDQRRKFCEGELEIGRRYAPEIYDSVVPIRQIGQRLSVDGSDGPIVEFAVKMRQFEQALLLEPQLKAAKIPVSEMDRLAEQLAQYVSAAEHVPLTGEEAVDRAVQPAQENFDYLLGHLQNPNQRLALETLKRWNQTEVGALNEWFAERGTHGFFRHCHGDLHLNNILRQEGKYFAFDAIEFNDRLSQIDAMNEIAFLMMELREHGYPTHSRRMINHFVEALNDYAGVRGLPFYLIYRALVRAKVDLIRSEQKESESQRSLSAAGWKYVEYAQHIAARPAPALWITHGLSGSGKSTKALELVESMGLFRVRSDVIRKRLMGIEPLQKTPDAQLDQAYSESMTQKIYDRLKQSCEQVLASGYGAIADATFLKRAQRRTFADLAARLNIPLRIVSCSAPLPELEQRLSLRGPDPSDATSAVVHRQKQTAEPLSEEELALVWNKHMT